MNRSTKMLPTIKKLCCDEDQMNYQSYQQNGLILKHKVTSIKIGNLVRTFITKLKRNITKSQPVDFKLAHNSQADSERWIKWKGWDVEDRFEGFILIMDMLMSLIMFYIATFQGLLDDFLLGDNVSDAVIVIKAVAIFFFSVRMLMDLVTIDYENDFFYVYITDIIYKYFTEARFLVYLFELIMTILCLANPYDQAIGIILCFAVFFKLLTTTKNIRQLEQIFFSSSRSYYIWNLVKLLIFNIFFGHTVSTIFLAIARINSNQNWILFKLVNNGLVDSSLVWYKVYIWGYYWATTMITTVGYGDITPVDFREAIVVALCEVFGTMILAYNISEVGSIITSIRKPNIILDRKLAVIRRMNKQNSISDELQGKIESYLAHQLEIKQTFQYEQHRQIMNNLPQQLKQQYYQEANKTIYSRLPFFKDLQSSIKIALTQAFEGKVYYPKQYIIKCRQPINEVVIMRKGKFSLCFWKQNCEMNGTVVQTISNEQNGIPYLLTTNILSHRCPLKYDMIANQYSYALVLPFQKFKEIIKKSRIDYFYYLSILDMHEKNPNPYDYVVCSYCRDSWHTKFDCPKLHYIPYTSEVAYHEQKTPGKNVERAAFKRLIKSINCYRLRKHFYKSLEKQVTSSIQQDQVEHQLNVDVAENFTQYFQPWNCDNLKEIAMGRGKRKLTRFGKTILQSLRKIHSMEEMEFKLELRMSKSGVQHD